MLNAPEPAVDAPRPAGRLGPLLECDVVMKGGITSGVVYPLAIVELAQKYRFRNIGGTSAGAIAAAMAAAAEYARDRGGFDRLRDLAGQLGGVVQDLFQPTRKLRIVFRMLMASLRSGPRWLRLLRMIWVALRGYWGTSLVCMGLGAALAVTAAVRGYPVSACVLAVIVWLVALGAALVARLWRAVFTHLPRQNFGICPGLHQPDGVGPALTEWLADRLEWVAGRMKADDPATRSPLTFGDLRGPNDAEPIINLQVMTTNLGVGFPFRMPGPKFAFEQNLFMYREEDFRALFPEHIVKWMNSKSNPVTDAPQYRWLPLANDLPVVVAVRMSLSFPALIAAVPLYARDFTFQDSAAHAAPRKCWFTDGGLCSNFPIHFFDSVWPSRPTFGILLEPYLPEHHAQRVELPFAASQGTLQSMRSFDTLGGFFSTLLDTMQEWRDNLQTVLPGYRERVARVRLAPEEGGMNLNMPADRIKALSDRGREAGETLLRVFDWDDHRWRRHLVWIAELEQILGEMRAAYEVEPPGGDNFRDFLKRYARAPASYENPEAWCDAMDANLLDLTKLIEAWRSRPLAGGKIPRPEVQMRLAPKL